MGARRLVAVAVLTAPCVAAVGGCSVEQLLPIPSCAEGDTAILVAQSVPGADLVPCFEPIPTGWDVDTVTIDEDGTVIRFDSDRAGSGAAVFRYVASCELGDAVSVPSERDDARRYDLIESVAPSFRAERSYVFRGGCIRWEFDFAEGATAALAIELGDQLVTITRAELNESIRTSFLDEQV